jgi:hypothetical protein
MTDSIWRCEKSTCKLLHMNVALFTSGLIFSQDKLGPGPVTSIRGKGCNEKATESKSNDSGNDSGSATVKRRSIVATRQYVDERPPVDSLERIYLGERALIGDEPVIVTKYDVDGGHHTLEGWHARTGQLVGWRWEELKLEEKKAPKRKRLGAEA